MTIGDHRPCMLNLDLIALYLFSLYIRKAAKMVQPACPGSLHFDLHLSLSSNLPPADLELEF